MGHLFEDRQLTLSTALRRNRGAFKSRPMLIEIEQQDEICVLPLNRALRNTLESKLEEYWSN